MTRFLYIIMLLASGLSACTRSSDEEQIRATLAAVEEAAEARDTSGVMQWIAADYHDDFGSDPAQLRNVLRAYFFSHPKVELLVSVKDVKLEGPSNARVYLELIMVGTEQTSDSTSLTTQSEPFRIDLRRIESKWKVVRVERRRD